MIDQLPQELIEQILGYLPAASSITNVSQVNKKLRGAVIKGRNSIFHDFVQLQFPSISAGPPWQEAASRLTSRSRAWDRRAFIARECAPPKSEGDRVARPRGQHFGFMPVIDSYQIDNSSPLAAKEVLAWGAGGRLQVRTTADRRTKWSTFSIRDDAMPQTDILDIRLLRPHQNRNANGESVFIRRANRELVLLAANAGKDTWTKSSRYLVNPEVPIDCVDFSEDANPLLAVCNSETIQLFPIHASEGENRASEVMPLAEATTHKQRKRCARFVSHTRIAVAPQYLEGLQPAPIEVFDLTSSPLQAFQQLRTSGSQTAGVIGRIGANVLAKVDESTSAAGWSSNLLLSGWSDGLVRLFDLRVGEHAVREYSDPVDDGQITSILSIGKERFLAGSHQNACLKVFDMRMGCRVYDHINAPTPLSAAYESGIERKFSRIRFVPCRDFARDINIFLALTVHRAAQPWQPLPGRHNNARLPRYRGSIYSLSSPSPSSPTVYAGIENHVIQLDFISTDDWAVNRANLKDEMDDRPILNLSCYERPRKGRESTDTVLLRKQADLTLPIVQRNETELSEWDERWQLEQQRSRKGMAASWWSGRP